MTRITNFGRKRTYVQAGFTDDAPVEEPQASTSTLPSESHPHSQSPATKKRKRTKKLEVNGAGDGNGNESAPSPKGEAQANYQQDDASKMLKGRRKTKVQLDHAQRSEARRQKRIAERYADTTCFACRQKGHAAKACPTTRDKALVGGSGKQTTVGICYRCGSGQHNLSRCKALEDPHNPLPFASCFVCNGKGHLASSCPQNKDKGVYPNGGCCKLCGETSHLAKDCGIRKQVQSGTATFIGIGHGAGADEDDFHMLKRKNVEVDRDIKKDEGVKKKISIRTEPYTRTTKAFGTYANNSTKTKKVVHF